MTIKLTFGQQDVFFDNYQNEKPSLIITKNQIKYRYLLEIYDFL